MLNELMSVFEKVLELAEKRKLAEPRKEGLINLGGVNLEDIVESDEMRNLREYLESLDYETVKTLQVIMYLGRDKDYNNNDTPGEILRKQREYYDMLGWSDEKKVEVSQMVQKMPLDNYLRSGLSILNIE